MERIMDERSARRPKWKPRRKQKKRRPRQFVKSNDSAGTNQLRQGAQDSKGIGEKHQNETAHDGVEGFSTRNLRDIGLREAHIPQAGFGYATPGSGNAARVAFDADHFLGSP